MQSISIVLTGEPRSTQHLYKFSSKPFPHVYMSAAGKATKADYIKQIREQYTGPVIEDEVSIEVVLYFGTMRKADWDNYHKISQDALVGTVMKDDSQITEAHIIKAFDRANPRIEYAIKPAI